MHHGERINWGQYVGYVDGDVDDIDLCSAEKMSILELNKMVGKLGHRRAAILYYYVEPNKDLSNGLRELCTDEDVNKFSEWVYKFKVMEVFCNHLTPEEIEKFRSPLIVKPVENKRCGVVIEELDEQGRIIGEPCSGKGFRMGLLFEEHTGTKDNRDVLQNSGLQQKQIGSSEQPHSAGHGQSIQQLASALDLEGRATTSASTDQHQGTFERGAASASTIQHEQASELDPERGVVSASTDQQEGTFEASTIQQPVGHHSSEQPIAKEGVIEDVSESESEHDSDRFSTGDYCGDEALLDGLIPETTGGGTSEQQFDEPLTHEVQPDSQQNNEATCTFSSQQHDAQQPQQKKNRLGEGKMYKHSSNKLEMNQKLLIHWMKM